MSDDKIRLDGDAAVVGGIHSDSHDVTHNTTTHNVSNTNTVYEAQKSDTQLRQENERQFFQAVSERISMGGLDQRALAELDQLRVYYQIPQDRANLIINQLRQSSAQINADNGNMYLASQLLDEVYSAISENRVDIVRRKYNALEKLAKSSSDTGVQFYFHLLLSSFDPLNCEMALLKSNIDNYWQLYWAHVAYTRNGKTSEAEALLPKLGAFGAPQGDISLLMAVVSAYEYLNRGRDQYYLNEAYKHLDNAANPNIGLSETLSPLWHAINCILQDGIEPEPWYEFYVNTTLAGFKPAAQISGSKGWISDQQGMAIPEMPPMPVQETKKFDPQSIQLSQMQGFNPVEAAKQMGLGTMPQMNMPQMGMPTMPQMNMPQTGMPAMPQMNMPQMGMPTMPQSTMPPIPGSVPPITNNNFTAPESSNSKNIKNIIPEENKDVDEPDPYVDLNGIILTDTEILARKYSISREEVINVFADFTDKAEEQMMHWAFLDIADWRHTMPSETWLDYNNLISSFINEYNLPKGPELHLMIVGGPDVIPVPEVDDPYGSSDTGMLPTDTCYSFPGEFIPNLVAGADLKFKYSEARNNVCRLPLESGAINNDIRMDLGAYFNLCSLYGGGIPVKRVVMTSFTEWLPASATMSQHLPLLYNTGADEIVRERMYVSPNLYTNDAETLAIYEDSIGKADMLMFNLHGASTPSKPGFYSYDEAFNPELLSKSNARVFNTVACYGARYYGYSREQSMVLTALYGGGVLLYTGALIPVPMYSSESDESRELLFHPGTGSEVFMRLLPLYQLKGLTAGEALLKAKCDYFNMMRHVENDDFSLATALMFCTYGNPMLHVRKNEKAVEAARNNSIIPIEEVKADGGPVKSILKQRVMEKKQETNVSLLDTIRGYVDQNLATIRSYVEQYVHQALGLPPQYLDSIDAISRPLSDGNYSPGYYFNYHDPNAWISPDTRVEIDSNGTIKRIYTTK